MRALSQKKGVYMETRAGRVTNAFKERTCGRYLLVFNGLRRTAGFGNSFGSSGEEILETTAEVEERSGEDGADSLKDKES
jgi:hypothetical protein